MELRITEDFLKTLCSPTSYERGVSLYESHAVFDLYRQNDTLVAKCEGTSAPYYHVSARFDENGIVEADCSCPYDLGGLCKHLVAMLFTYLNEPDLFKSRIDLRAQLSQLDRTTLEDLLTVALNEHSDGYSWLESALLKSTTQFDPTQPFQERKTKISKANYTKRVQAILRSLDGYRMSEAYWMMPDMVYELEGIEQIASDFLEAGDPESGFVILMVLLTEVAGRYDHFDDSDGLLGEFLFCLRYPLVETILSMKFSDSEREAITLEIEPIIDDLNAYGIEGLELIIDSLRMGWSDDEMEDWDSEDDFSTALINAKLNILERQNRVDEYLDLSFVSGRYLRHVLMLITLGKFERAAEIARQNLNAPGDILLVSQALQESGLIAEAIQLGQHGLSLEGSLHQLGSWLAPIEVRQGMIEQAIRTYRLAFESRPTFNIYRALKALNPPNWEDLRNGLIETLQKSGGGDDLVDVYLYECEWDQATKIADQARNFNYHMVEKVANAVLPYRPKWVAEACQFQAESLIAKSSRKYYRIAVRWLSRSKQAYLVADQEDEWLKYLRNLKLTYPRRYALLEELESL